MTLGETFLRRVIAVVAALLVGPAAPVVAYFLSMEDWNGDARFGFNYEKQEISQPESFSQLDRLFFEERVGIRSRGNLYDPDLARFDMGFDLGFFEDELDTEAPESSTSRAGDGRLIGYDLNLGLLSNLPIRLDLFGHRSENNTRRDFAGQIKTDFDGFGVTGHVDNLPLRSTLTMEQQHVSQRFTLIPAALQQNETRRIASYYGERRNEVSTLTADYRFEDVNDRARLQRDFRLHSAGLNHFLRFGTYFDDILNSSARLFRRDGAVSTTNLLLHEAAQLRHSLSVSSNYGYSLSFLDSAGNRSVSQNLLAGLEHQFYESLTSGAQVKLGYASLSPGNWLNYGGGVNTEYRKKIPWRGTFLAGAGIGYEIIDQSVPGGRLSVFEEAHRFSDSEPVLLDNPDVIDSTIVVTDESRSTVFVEGSDYSVEHIGSRTALRRNPFGRIEAGQTVLVSYDFDAGRSVQAGSRPITVHTGLDFTWIYLYYRREQLGRDVFRGNAANVLRPVDTNRAGVETRLPLQYANVFLVYEYFTYDAVDIRYEGASFSQNLTSMPFQSLTVGVTANEAFFNFSLPKRTRDFYSARWNLSWNPLSSLSLDAYTGVRRLRETDIPRDQLVDFGGRSRWSIGLFDLSFSYSHDLQDVGLVGRTGDLVQLEITRRFF